MKSVAALLALTLAGCGTIGDLAGHRYAKTLFDGPAPHVFGGVRIDAFVVPTCSPRNMSAFLYVFDFPFSFALDVALLPISAPLALLSSPEPKEPKDGKEVPK